jgi:5-amino-6-(5-phosphoribosylamino)uracil reductase/diaminohydroxyphosphoribosylaminopyrimidine deaminase/5-amino-6-(5-phosphoribosylamino)uracil reductase
MVWSLERAAVDAAWPPLLALREVLRGPGAKRPRSVWFRRRGDGWELQADAQPEGEGLFVPLAPSAAISPPSTATFHMDRFLEGRDPLERCDAMAAERLAPFRLYLPALLGGAPADANGHAFLTAHLAQSLDGRIACRNGQSQWIGNEANLLHAHRLRAIHDAVLVGRRTVERDDPRLTVREVEGNSPARVVVSGSGKILGSWRNYRAFDGEGATVLCGIGASRASRDADGRVTVVGLPCEVGGRIEAKAISGALATRGLRSAFVEGGGVTVSGFLESGWVDLLHLHVAPLILGSGIDAFTLPEVHSVREGRRLLTEHFLLEGELLLECRLAPAAS